MRDGYAEQLLARVMKWHERGDVDAHLPRLQLLADYKYDHYQQFGPGLRFIESLALWLSQFDSKDRDLALKFVEDRLIFISDAEMSHLVQIAYPDMIAQERITMVAEEKNIPTYQITKIINEDRYKELKMKSLYLGLSDGARTNEIRRASQGEINNEQIWQAYELGKSKAKEMIEALKKNIEKARLPANDPRFNLVWLFDDFSGSGNTYIRFDKDENKFKGKIPKIYSRLNEGDLVDPTYYNIYLVLYTATRQAINHIEYWSERFTTHAGYKPLQVQVIHVLEPEVSITHDDDKALDELIDCQEYYDAGVEDNHTAVGGTLDVKRGFAGCGLPVVLSHNTPNNSIYLLWGPEACSFKGLFPRVSRHVAS